MSDQIDYEGLEQLDDRKLEPCSAFSDPKYKPPEIVTKDVEKISPGYNDLISRLSMPRLSKTPTFFGYRAGISERFIDEAVLPLLRDMVNKPVIVPFFRSIWGGNLGPLAADTKSIENLKSPMIIGGVAINAYDELLKRLKPDQRKYLKSRSEFKKITPLIFSKDYVNKYLKQTAENPIPPDILKVISFSLDEVAIEFDPICDFQGITIFEAKTQEEALFVLQRVMEQANKKQFANDTKNGAILLVELFEPINEKFLGKLRDILREWVDQKIIVWLHAAVQYLPLELLDQFQNHIIIHPSSVEIDILQQVQGIDATCIKSKRDYALVRGPCIEKNRGLWEIIHISEISHVEEEVPPITTSYNRSKLRELMREMFTDSHFMSFCQDNYPSVQKELSSGMAKSDKISLLMEYCERSNSYDKLVILLKSENLAFYSKYEKDIIY